MPVYKAPLQDIRFVLHDVLASEQLTEIPDYAEASADLVDQILEEGAKLKAFVFFKGRSIIFKEQGHILLLRLAQDLEEYGKVEQLPKLEGKKMIMLMNPKK